MNENLKLEPGSENTPSRLGRILTSAKGLGSLILGEKQPVTGNYGPRTNEQMYAALRVAAKENGGGWFEPPLDSGLWPSRELSPSARRAFETSLDETKHLIT